MRLSFELDLDEQTAAEVRKHFEAGVQVVLVPKDWKSQDEAPPVVLWGADLV